MTSVVEICNRALSHTGTDIQIRSLEERSKEAKLCKLWYVATRDRLLRAGIPWGFAIRRTSLALLGDGPTGWEYEYRYPANALKIMQVYTAGNFNSMLPYAYQFDPVNLFQVTNHSDGGRSILSNEDQAESIYIYRVEEVGDFDELFTEALEYKLAMQISMPLAGDPNISNRLRNMYQFALSEAMAVSANESHEAPMPDAEWVQDRGLVQDNYERKDYYGR